MEQKNEEELRNLLYHKLQKQNITCHRVLKAVRTLPKSKFIPSTYKYSLEQIYGDSPLEIWRTTKNDPNEVLKDYRITISATYIHAFCVQEVVNFLAPTMCLYADETSMPEMLSTASIIPPTILEIGFGSMYQTALLAQVFPKAQIKAIEIVRGLGEDSIRRHINNPDEKSLWQNVEVSIDDGFKGWTKNPDLQFDAIILSAAPRMIPDVLKQSLKSPGILIGPVGEAEHQYMIKIIRNGDTFTEQRLFPVRFVPMLSSS